MAKQDERTKLIGRKAEHHFKGFCIDEDVTATHPTYDEHGWDYLIELPKEKKPLVYRDLAEQNTKCLVQVKSTDDFSDLRYDLTLTNWEHLTQTIMPCFVFIVDFRGQDTPQRTFFCHVDHARIGAVMKRLRELSVKGAENFHERKMQLVADTAEEVLWKNNGDLVSTIRSYVGGSIEEYLSKKVETIKSVGFGNGTHLVSFTSIASLKQFTNALLGVGKLKITQSKIYDTRFDIKSGEREFVSEGELTVTPDTVGECTLEVSARGQFRKLRLVGNAFITPKVLGEDLQKLRVARKSFDLLVANDDFSINFHFDPETVYNLRELSDDLEFLSTANQKGAVIELFRQGTRFCSGKNTQGHAIDKGMLRLQEVVRTIRKFTLEFGVSDDFTITIPMLNEQYEELSWFAFANKRESFDVSLDLTAPTRMDVSRKKGIFANPVILRGDAKSLVLFAYWQAKISVHEKAVACSLSHPVVLDLLETVHNEDDIVVIQERLEEFNERCRKLAKGTLINKTITFKEKDNEDVMQIEAQR